MQITQIYNKKKTKKIKFKDKKIDLIGFFKPTAANNFLSTFFYNVSINVILNSILICKSMTTMLEIYEIFLLRLYSLKFLTLFLKSQL